MTSSSSSAVAESQNLNILVVHEVQKGNPLLAFIKNVKWKFSNDIKPDYVMGSTCAIFVSVKYHFRHPKHILRRMDEVGTMFKLRVLLVLVDDEHNLQTLQELNKLAFARSYTLIFAWSNLECARYIETLKIMYFWYDTAGKSSSAAHVIQERVETEFLPKVTQVLTTVRSINKTDVITLMDAFGSVRNICHADEHQLVLCPGIGEKKVKRLYQALHEPFLSAPSSKKMKPMDPVPPETTSSGSTTAMT
eukprot:gene31827-41305_t